ncbi:MAG: thermonuclease family protein [Alphaproteobacteria bacterium]|nr:thermonuclease family protein [Alphaproteobacteria bacterium]
MQLGFLPRPVIVPAIAFASIAAAGSAPAEDFTAMERAGAVRAERAIDGDTLALADGRELRLIGIAAPKSTPKGPLHRVAEAARQELDRLAAGRTLTLYSGGRPSDRRQRLLAHAVAEDGTWLQGAMLAAGLARVETFADNRARAAEMLALEATARKERRGIWAEPRFRVLTPEQAERWRDGYHLVEGRVLRVSEEQGRLALEFSPNGRRGFVVAVPVRQRAQFRAAGLDPAGLAGTTLRVRGWIHRRLGPEILASHPEQIERLTQ